MEWEDKLPTHFYLIITSILRNNDRKEGGD